MYSIVVLFCVTVSVLTSPLPSDIQPCSLSDEHFNECLTANAQKWFSVFANGNKELGVPSLDPFDMGTVITEAQPGPISIYQKYSDSKITGFSKLHVDKFEINLNDCRMYLEASIPLLAGNSEAVFKGQMLLFPIDSKSNVTVIFKNIGMKATAKCKILKKGENEFIHLTSTTFSTTNNKNFELHIGTLIKGNEQLDEEIHKVLKEDPLAIWEIMKPAGDATFAAFFKNIGNNLFKHVSLSDLFKN